MTAILLILLVTIFTAPMCIFSVKHELRGVRKFSKNTFETQHEECSILFKLGIQHAECDNNAMTGVGTCSHDTTVSGAMALTAPMCLHLENHEICGVRKCLKSGIQHAGCDCHINATGVGTYGVLDDSCTYVDDAMMFVNDGSCLRPQS